MPAEGRTLAEYVADHQAEQRALRRLLASGGKTAATTNALARRTVRLHEIERILTVKGFRVVAGSLVEQRKLRARLAADPERPELRIRLELITQTLASV